MKRDMDLIREILRQMEEFSDLLGEVKIKAEGRSSDEVNYHVYLLHQAGLIQAVSAVAGGAGARAQRSAGVLVQSDSFKYIPLRLTWQGHEFLDAARNDTLWRKVKAKVLAGGGGLVFEVLKAALVAEIKQSLRLGPGE